MAFRPFSFGFGGSGGYPLPQRPGMADLLDPLFEPEYPEEPAYLSRGRDLRGPDRRGLTMEMLANLAAALGGAEEGRLGGALARAASANIGAEQGAVERANEAAGRDFRRKTQEAERLAARKRGLAEREQEKSQIESMFAVGDKAIELAGGADADPGFATKVYSAMRERNTSMLQGLLSEAPSRKAMREKYKMDPDDPLALEAYKKKRDLDAKVEERKALDPLEDADELEDYEEKKKIDRRYPAPREPPRDRMWFDQSTGQIVNLDTQQTSAPIAGYQPKPRSGQQFDDVEREAMDAANRAQAQYEKDAMRPMDRAGNPVPFNWEAAYRANERTLRKIANEKAAAADPSTGGRGPAPEVSPQGKGVQAPSGAPIGPGGGPGKQSPPNAELDHKVRNVAATVGGLSAEQEKIVRQELRKYPPREVVRIIQWRKQGKPGLPPNLLMLPGMP